MVSEVYSKSIVFPKKYSIDTLENGSKAKISIFPLQQGFGVTIGNILRRTLLSSIRGIAIDKMKITDAVHEYSTIDGVKENVCDIIYNLRRVVFSSDKDFFNASVSVNGPKKVYASDIKVGSGVKIINPDCFLFEVVSDRQIDIELDLCAGIGDIFVSQQDSNDIGYISFDKHFSPVLNVNVSVSQTRLDNRTDYDKLVLEIKTNGSISAEESFKSAVSILTNFLMAIDDAKNKMYNNVPDEKTTNIEVKNDVNYNLFRKVDELEMSVRSLNCLRNDGVVYIGDLVNKQEIDMMKTPNFGRKSLNELKRMLADMNLSFGMDIEWPPKNLNEMVAEAKKFFNCG